MNDNGFVTTGENSKMSQLHKEYSQEKVYE